MIDHGVMNQWKDVWVREQMNEREGSGGSILRQSLRKGEHMARTVVARGECGREGKVFFFVLSCFSKEVL